MRPSVSFFNMPFLSQSQVSVLRSRLVAHSNCPYRGLPDNHLSFSFRYFPPSYLQLIDSLSTPSRLTSASRISLLCRMCEKYTFFIFTYFARLSHSSSTQSSRLILIRRERFNRYPPLYNNLCTSAWVCIALWIVSNFLVFLSIFLSSSIVQLITPAP